MKEMWKDIPGYEGLYQASNTGHIRTVEGKVTYSVRHGERHWHSRVLKEKWEKRNRCTNGHSDARVMLYKDKVNKTMLVARLVAMAWVEGYKEGLTVNHIDGDPSNNVYTNLEWVTHGDNIRKGFETGAYPITKSVTLTNLSSKEKHEFRSMSDASRFLGRCTKYISNCFANGKMAKGNGAVWEIKR